MKDETKEKIKSTLLGLGLGLVFGFVISVAVGCGISASQKPEETHTTSYTTLKGGIEPKRAQNGQTYTITNTGNTQVEIWANGYANYTINGGQSQQMVWNDSISYTIKLSNSRLMNVGTSAGGYELARNKTTYAINDAVTMYVTAQNPYVWLENTFPEATNEGLFVMDGGTYVLAVPNNDTAQIPLYTLAGKTILHRNANATNDSFYVDVDNTNTIASNTNLWEPTASDLEHWIDGKGTNTYTISPVGTYYSIKNMSLTEVIFSEYNANWNITLATGQALKWPQGSNINFSANKAFVLEYNGEYITSNVIANSYDYYAVIPDLQGNITILSGVPTGTGGDASSILENTFVLIGASFSALIPILNLKIMEDLTIGLLLFIPLTFALIALIFRLIKK